jgi:translocator protein
MSFLRVALFTVPAVLLLGTLSGRLSGSGYGNPWFDALEKPSFMPPGWAFGVVWPILYLMLGLALAIIIHARGARGRPLALSFFAAQLLLNLIWSPLFFAAHQVGAALALLAALLVLALATAILFARIRTSAGLLFIPYLGWLCFATALNYQIWVLNPDASTVAPAASSADIPV